MATGKPLPAALKRELQGWYIYDFANSAFFQSAGAVFIPLLVDAMATEYAWHRQGASRPETCADLADAGETQTNCLRCVEGDGDVLVTANADGSETHAELDVLKLPGGINPTSFLFTCIALSVLFQAIAFVTVGALGDFGNHRKRGLVVSATTGAIVTCFYVVPPAKEDGSLYWLGGVLIIIANVCLGVSVVFYNSYLPLMVDDAPAVSELEAAAAAAAATAAAESGGGGGGGGDDDDDDADAFETDAREATRAAQEVVGSEYSGKGQAWGYVGGLAALTLSLLIAVAMISAGASTWWALGVGAALSGVWWLVFGIVSFRRLPPRPGPPPPEEYRGARLLLMGWIRTATLLKKVWRKSRPTAHFLALYFVFSDGYSTIATVAILFASRELCMSVVELATLAVIVPLCAAAGGYLWMRFKARAKWSNKAVLVLNLFLLSWLPLWGCVGFFSDDFGLRTKSELYVLAVWFGAMLGSAQAYGRALFSELIPVGHEADMFALFEITDKGSSWLGPLVASLVLQYTGKVRPVLIYLLVAMVIPAGLLHRLDLRESIKAARHPKAGEGVMEGDDDDDDDGGGGGGGEKAKTRC